MLNQVILVGRLVKLEEPNIIIKVVSATTYDEWLLEIELPHSIFSNTQAYCGVDSVIGVKGHLEQGNKIVGEKITFLSTTKGGEEDDSNTVQEGTETESQS